MEPYQSIIFETDGPVAVIKLNRPEVLNAFSGGMGKELSHAYRRCDADESVRAVVLTGEGRAFCAGADFSSGAQVFDAPSDQSGFQSDPFEFHAWDVRKPVIAAINGHAVGLGLTMTLQCDLRLIAEDAKCGIVQNRRGVFPRPALALDAAAHRGLCHRARLAAHRPDVPGVAKPREMGLASRALPAEEVLPAAMELAHDIAVNLAPVSVGLSKRLLWSDPQLSGAGVNEWERLAHLEVMGAPDAREGSHRLGRETRPAVAADSGRQLARVG